MIRIGLYSEDRKLQSILSSAFGNGFKVLVESDEAGILRMLRNEGCDVVILDLDSNHSSLEKRVECARQIAASESASVVMVDDALRATAVELVGLGAHGYCRKPPSVRDLKTMIQRAYENVSLKRKLRSVEQQLAEVSNGCDQMIGCSSPMQQVYDLVHRVASLNASVLIVGESGTGKELIAQAIHNLGSRSDRPFVAVSCGAIPETLIESELFGHEKGAFTGTVGSREGYLEQAGDGTLFLDEVGEITLSTQVKLLRVLQQREFSRLGSNRLIPLRARIIFAIRQDLYYRINVMRIDAPSLQEHAEDIPTIALHFLHQYSETYEKPIEYIDQAAMAILQNYSWPGNVRELENTIQRAIIVASDSVIVEKGRP